MTAREAKPDWSAVPPVVVGELESLLGSRPFSGEIMWGGYSPSASFRLQLENGHQVFAKGSYPGQDSFSVIANRREAEVYDSLTKLNRIAPHYLGHIEREGWFMLVLESLTPAEPTLPWNPTKLRAVFAKMGEVRALYPDRASVPALVHNLADDPFCGDLYKGRDGFATLIADSQWQQVATHLPDMPDAHDWLLHERPALVQQEQDFCQLPDVQGLVHLDLRSDNILFDKDRGAVLLDWPCASWGPLAMDLGYFLLTCEAQGAGPLESFLPMAEQEMDYKMPEQNLRGMLAHSIGYLAARAIQSDIPELPRLRPWQRQLLGAAVGAYRRLG